MCGGGRGGRGDRSTVHRYRAGLMIVGNVSYNKLVAELNRTQFKYVKKKKKGKIIDKDGGSFVVVT